MRNCKEATTRYNARQFQLISINKEEAQKEKNYEKLQNAHKNNQ